MSSPTQIKWPKNIQQALKTLPGKPGVYEMRDEESATLYVGKAKDLRKRVQTYFRNSANHSPRIRKMLEKTADISWTEVSSEVEALILESNLIKEKCPKFNILLRDDKNFAYFCVSLAEDFPRLTLTRRVVKDGSLYFGPKTSASSVRQIIDLLRDILKLRSTNLEITETEAGKVEVKNPGNIKYPCLNYHLGKCSAPCIANITKAEYRTRIDRAIKFLRGDTSEMIRDLEAEMQQLAAEKKFEKAARIRDLYLAVKNISEKQVISTPDEFSADVIGLREKFGYAFFHLFQIRNGKVINSETFSFSAQNAESSTESLLAFLREHAERAADFPQCLVLSDQIFPKKEVPAWEEFFAKQWGQKVQIVLPQKGKRKKLLDLAERNALNYADRNAASFIKHTGDQEETLQILQKKLNMPEFPKRIECYDISHLGGTETTAAMVVFVDGEAKKEHYRRFQIHTLSSGEIDDYKAMAEVVQRRLARLTNTTKEDEQTWREEGVSYGKARKNEEERIVQIMEENTAELSTENVDYKDFFLAREKKEIVGFARLVNTGSVREIKSLWITKKFRGRKMGQFLVRKILETVKKGKVYIICGDPGLVEYYAQIGFRNVHTPPRELLQEMQRFHRKHPQCPPGIVMTYDTARNKKDASFSTYPRLLLVDGGKGQLAAAQKILQQFSLTKKIHICALAKQFEEVYIPGKSGPVHITKDSSEGQLLQNIRDEAHRFAISYHKKLHQKVQKKSILDEISGIGSQTKKTLLRTFGSVKGITDASDEQLLKVVGTKTLALLRKNL